MVNISEIKCKTALSKSNLPGLDYSLNPYTGCQHNCCYCYVPNVLHIDRKLWGSFVNAKTNIPNILSKELRKKKPGVIGISTVTDPYQPVEKKYRLTRYCLEQLLRHDFPVCIQTKSKLIIRDVDLISKLKKVEVMVSIGTIDDQQRKILEPFSSPIKDRLKILDVFSKIKNVETSIFFGPIYPTVTKKDVQQIIELFSGYNISQIMIDRFNLKPGIQQSIKEKVKSNPRFQEIFTKNLSNDEYHKGVINQIKEEGGKRNIKITDAF